MKRCLWRTLRHHSRTEKDKRSPDGEAGLSVWPKCAPASAFQVVRDCACGNFDIRIECVELTSSSPRNGIAHFSMKVRTRRTEKLLRSASTRKVLRARFIRLPVSSTLPAGGRRSAVTREGCQCLHSKRIAAWPSSPFLHPNTNPFRGQHCSCHDESFRECRRPSREK